MLRAAVFQEETIRWVFTVSDLPLLIGSDRQVRLGDLVHLSRAKLVRSGYLTI